MSLDSVDDLKDSYAIFLNSNNISDDIMNHIHDGFVGRPGLSFELIFNALKGLQYPTKNILVLIQNFFSPKTADYSKLRSEPIISGKIGLLLPLLKEHLYKCFREKNRILCENVCQCIALLFCFAYNHPEYGEQIVNGVLEMIDFSPEDIDTLSASLYIVNGILLSGKLEEIHPLHSVLNKMYTTVLDMAIRVNLYNLDIGVFNIFMHIFEMFPSGCLSEILLARGVRRKGYDTQKLREYVERYFACAYIYGKNFDDPHCFSNICDSLLKLHEFIINSQNYIDEDSLTFSFNNYIDFIHNFIVRFYEGKNFSFILDTDTRLQPRYEMVPRGIVNSFMRFVYQLTYDEYSAKKKFDKLCSQRSGSDKNFHHLNMDSERVEELTTFLVDIITLIECNEVNIVDVSDRGSWFNAALSLGNVLTIYLNLESIQEKIKRLVTIVHNQGTAWQNVLSIILLTYALTPREFEDGTLEARTRLSSIFELFYNIIQAYILPAINHCVDNLRYHAIYALSKIFYRYPKLLPECQDPQSCYKDVLERIHCFTPRDVQQPFTEIYINAQTNVHIIDSAIGLLKSAICSFERNTYKSPLHGDSFLKETVNLVKHIEDVCICIGDESLLSKAFDVHSVLLDRCPQSEGFHQYAYELIQRLILSPQENNEVVIQYNNFKLLRVLIIRMRDIHEETFARASEAAFRTLFRENNYSLYEEGLFCLTAIVFRTTMSPDNIGCCIRVMNNSLSSRNTQVYYSLMALVEHLFRKQNIDLVHFQSFYDSVVLTLDELLNNGFIEYIKLISYLMTFYSDALIGYLKIPDINLEYLKTCNRPLEFRPNSDGFKEVLNVDIFNKFDGYLRRLYAYKYELLRSKISEEDKCLYSTALVHSLYVFTRVYHNQSEFLVSDNFIEVFRPHNTKTNSEPRYEAEKNYYNLIAELAKTFSESYIDSQNTLYEFLRLFTSLCCTCTRKNNVVLNKSYNAEVVKLAYGYRQLADQAKKVKKLMENT